MSKEEAIKKLYEGDKVTHKMFCNDEFVYMKDGDIHNMYDENGTVLISFWQFRQSAVWQKGWSVFTGI